MMNQREFFRWSLGSLNSMDDFSEVSDALNQGDCLKILPTISEDWTVVVEGLSSNSWQPRRRSMQYSSSNSW